MWELDYKESWLLKNWCFWPVVLEKTLESPLDCKEIQPVHSKGDQPWDFFGRTDAKAETPVLWPPHAHILIKTHFSIYVSMSMNFMRVLLRRWNTNDWRKWWHFWKKSLVSSGHTGCLRFLGESDTWSPSNRTWGKGYGLQRQFTPVPPLEILYYPFMNFNLVLR